MHCGFCVEWLDTAWEVHSAFSCEGTTCYSNAQTLENLHVDCVVWQNKNGYVWKKCLTFEIGMGSRAQYG